MHGGEEAAHVLGDVAHVAGDVVGVGADVAHVLIQIGDALDLGDSTHLEAIMAGILGFKAAGAVIPIIAQLGSGIAGLALNLRTAPSLAAFFAEIPIGPLGIAAAAVGLLGAGIVLLGSRESAEAADARESAAAHRAQAAAIKSVMDAERAAADKGLAAKQATLDVKDAEQALHDARKQHGKDSDDAKRAEIDYDQALLRSRAAHDAYNTSLRQQHSEAQKLIDQSKKRRQGLIDDVAQLEKQVALESRGATTAGGRKVPTAASPDTLASLAAAQNRLSQANRDYIASVARATVTDTSRNRLMEASTQITQRNQAGIAKLIQALDGIPKEKQTKLLLSDQGSLAKLGSYIASLHGVVSAKTTQLILRGADSAKSALLAFEAIAAGIPASKVTHILAQTGSARAEIAALQGLLAGLHDRTISINTVYHVSGTPAGTQLGRGTGGGRRARGRGPIGSENALVGEGRGPELVANPRTGDAFMVNEPTFMRLAPEDYVIPTESAYAGRAAGLLVDLLTSWGMHGYKAGKPGKKPAKKKKHRAIPHHVDHLAYSPDELDSRASDAESRYNALKQQSDDKDKKGKLTTKARRARGKLAQARADLRAAKQDAARAKDYAGRITAQEEFADIDADQMRLADKHDDQGAYDKSRKDRLARLAEEKRLLKIAFRHAPKNSAWYRELAKRLGVIDNDLFDTSVAAQDVPDQAETEADRIANTGMTDAERARLADLDAARRTRGAHPRPRRRHHRREGEGRPVGADPRRGAGRRRRPRRVPSHRGHRRAAQAGPRQPDLPDRRDDAERQRRPAGPDRPGERADTRCEREHAPRLGRPGRFHRARRHRLRRRVGVRRRARRPDRRLPVLRAALPGRGAPPRRLHRQRHRLPGVAVIPAGESGLMDDPKAELLARLTAVAREVLPPITQEMRVDLDLDDEQTRIAGHALGRAFMQGVHAGSVEQIAQLIEKGHRDVGLNILGGLDEDPDA